MTAPAGRAPGSAACAEASRRLVISRRRFRQPLRRPAAFPAAKAGRGGGRNARATSFACAFLEVFPPAIRFHGSPAATGSAATLGKLRNIHVSLHTLLSRLMRPAMEKRDGFVQKLWRMRLACGKPRKTKTDPGPLDAEQFQPLRPEAPSASLLRNGSKGLYLAAYRPRSANIPLPLEHLTCTFGRGSP